MNRVTDMTTIRKKRAAEAMSYNGLVQSWPEIVRLSREVQPETPAQGALL